MALNRSEKINLVQMAMKRVNVVPYRGKPDRIWNKQ